jgi:hypothetical protein
VITMPTPSALKPGGAAPPDVDVNETGPPCGLVSVTTSGCPGPGVGGLAVATLAPPSTTTDAPVSDANNAIDADASPWVSWDPTTLIVCVPAALTVSSVTWNSCVPRSLFLNV